MRALPCRMLGPRRSPASDAPAPGRILLALLGALHRCPLCRLRAAGPEGCCAACRAAAFAPGGGTDAVWLGPFHGPLRDAVHALKFRHGARLAPWLGAALAARVRERGWRPALVTAVPLDARRLRQRGYNQSELLARHAARALGVPYRACLVRSRATLQQARLARAERVRNVAGAFRATGRVPQRLLLVDDVFTTGATARACELALRRAGALRVYLATVARA